MPRHASLPAAAGLLAMLATAAPAAPPRSPPAPQIDCAKIAAMPHSGMSLETCQQMLAAKQAYDASAADPAAQRPGDAQMSCEQIAAEMRAQPWQAPDQAKVAEGQAAAQGFQGKMKEQQAEVAAVAARDNAELAAARVADLKVQVATAGIVQGQVTKRVVQAQEAEHKVIGERMAAEREPYEKRLTGSVGNVIGDATQQLNANPRLARLMELSREKKCRF
ncbi:MAG: hypothetical protein JSR54_16975 [Proteobacteria bacterium]|nr:hypothetical protein [Pseudomonadota bacterium]